MASCQDINRSDINMTGIREIQQQSGETIYIGKDENLSNLEDLPNYQYYLEAHI